MSKVHQITTIFILRHEKYNIQLKITKGIAHIAESISECKQTTVLNVQLNDEIGDFLCQSYTMWLLINVYALRDW